MKKIFLFLPILFLYFISCNDKWDKYFQDNSMSVVELDMTVKEFLKNTSDYSKFDSLINNTGLSGELTKEQLVTVWAINNSNLNVMPIADGDTTRVKYHMNNLSFTLDELRDGLRIKSMNGIYFEINQREDGYYVNNVAKVLKSFRLKDGVVYEISEALVTRISLYEYIKNLSDEYSIIRDTIFKDDTAIFDQALSIPVSVDSTGNTEYDSTFVIRNPFFANANFLSEFEQHTAFIPSNKVIDSCFRRMNAEFNLFGMVSTAADSAKAWNWIKQSVFYKGLITNFSSTDLVSAFNTVWRTTIQKLEPTSTTLSNGLVYKIESMKIPRNVVGGGKIKSFFHYWQYCTPEQKKEWFKYEYIAKKDSGQLRVKDENASPSLTCPSLTTDRTRDQYTCLNIGYEPNATTETAYYDSVFSFTSPSLEKYFVADSGKYFARIMKIPPGEYDFYMGFDSPKPGTHPDVDIYFNGVKVRSIVTMASSPWHYDRSTNTIQPSCGGKKVWDGYGGSVSTVVIPGNELTSFEIKVQYVKRSAGERRITLYHWCLVPTSNNY